MEETIRRRENEGITDVRVEANRSRSARPESGLLLTRGEDLVTPHVRDSPNFAVAHTCTYQPAITQETNHRRRLARITISLNLRIELQEQSTQHVRRELVDCCLFDGPLEPLDHELSRSSASAETTRAIRHRECDVVTNL